MKRVLSVLVICALLLAGLTSFVGAEGTVPALAITVDQTAVKQGDTVTATVNALNYTATSWSAMTVKVTYDPAYLSFNEDAVVSGNAALEDIQTVVADIKGDEGIIFINWINSDGVPAADYLVQLQFTALAETTNAVISAEFTADGQAELGSAAPIVNTDGSAFSSDAVQSAPIEVQPEEDSEESSKTITGGNDFAGGSATIAVKGNYVNDENAKEDNYKVVIKWDDFTYTFSNGKYWDVNTLSWKQNIDEEGNNIGTWGTVEPKNIEITNYSSLPVTVTADYADNQKGDFTFENNGATVAAVVDETDTLGEATIKATFEPGDLTIDAPNVPLGNIIVTIV